MTKEGCAPNHIFVVKNDQQIIKEKYNHSIHIIYQNYLNKLYLLMRHLCDYLIKQSCQISTIKISHFLMHEEVQLNSDEVIKFQTILNDFMQQMKHDPYLFKSKLLYQHLVNDPINSYYYLKTYSYLQEDNTISLCLSMQCDKKDM